MEGKMRSTKLLVGGATLLIVGIIISLSGALPTKPKQHTIKLGALLCLTGSCAEWGQNALNGITLAVETINSEGGILGRPLEIIAQDSKEDSPSDAVTAYRQLTLDSEIQFIIGPTWTAAALALAPLISRDKTLVAISPSVGVREFNEAASNLYNLWPHDENATRSLARYAASKGYRRAAIFSSEQPWVKQQGDTFEEEFLLTGGSIAIKVESLPHPTELQAEALKITSSSPDVVFISNLIQLDTAAKELRKLGYHGPKLALLANRSQLEQAKGSLEDTVMAKYQEPAEWFRKTYEKRFNEPPGMSADTAYDAVILYLTVLQASTRPDEVPTALRDISLPHGASGSIRFDEKGAVKKTPRLVTVKGTSFIPVTP